MKHPEKYNMVMKQKYLKVKTLSNLLVLKKLLNSRGEKVIRLVLCTVVDTKHDNGGHAIECPSSQP